MAQRLTPEIVNAAIDGFEQQKVHIDAQIAELRGLLNDDSATPAVRPEPTGRKRRKFSAAARKRMREAQQRRWAKVRGEAEQSAPATPEPARPKRRISPDGMKRIIAATKKRWRLQKAAVAKAAAKKTTVARKKAGVTRAAVQTGSARKTGATRKGAVKTGPAKAAKRAPATKSAPKKTAKKNTVPAAGLPQPEAAEQ